MGNRVEIENIEERRREVGIDDVALREDIRRLNVGDIIKLTLLTDTESFAGETVLIRITSIRGPAFRGKLVCKPVSRGLSRLGIGSPVAFTAAHIHSLASKPRSRVAITSSPTISSACSGPAGRLRTRHFPPAAPGAEGPCMIPKPNLSSRPAAGFQVEARPRASNAPQPTTDDRLRDIAAMGQRIHGYVQIMCEIGNLGGTSAEAKETAIAAFHARLAALERQLGRIHEELRLG